MGTFWRKTSKEEYSEKIKKGLTTNVADTTLVRDSGQQIKGINGTPKTLGRYYKGGSSHQQKPFSNKELEHKDPLKKSFKSQENRKREKHCKGS